MSAGSPEGDVATTRGVVFSALPGYRPLELDLYLPQRGARALCVYLHGGGWLRGTRRDGPGPVVPGSGALFVRMARRGLAVASIDYRLSGEARLPAQTDDVAAACAFLVANAQPLGVTGLPLVVWGVSAGGHLAAMRALDGAEPAVRAAVCWYAVTDLLAMPDDQQAAGGEADRGPGSREALVLGAPAAELPDRARAFSPVACVRPSSPPFLLAHGEADVLVPHRQSERLAAALRRAAVPVDLVSVPGIGHMFVGIEPAELERIVDESADFLLAACSKT